MRRGVSANVFVDNAAYREFLNSKFKATPVDMESAAVALVCRQQKMPFIAIRAISNLAGGTSSIDESAFSSLIVQNTIRVALNFITLASEAIEILEPIENLDAAE